MILIINNFFLVIIYLFYKILIFKQNFIIYAK